MRCVGTSYPVSISDSSGNLLFYGHSGILYDRLHIEMPNSPGLAFGLGQQAFFSVKQLGFDSLYYLFHIKDMLPAYFFGMYYSVIDMRINGGLGDIIPGMKNIPIPGMDDAMDLLTATRHKNNQDIWLVTKKYLTNQYASILVTSSGISSTIVLSNSNAPVANVQPENGDLQISPDGTKLVCRYFPQNDSAVEFCRFNIETGIVTPLFSFKPHLNGKEATAGYSSFSPDSKLLYISGYYIDSDTTGGLFQYDVSKTDSIEFMNSQILIFPFYEDQGFTHPFQIGPDWKIYIPRHSKDSLSVIKNPNIQGIGCNFEENAMDLAGRIVYKGLPQFLQKYKAYIHSIGDCQWDPVQFTGDIWPPADTIRWNFGDPASGISNISYDATPSHIYTTPGIYTIELYVRHIDNRTDTSWVTLEIFETPSPDLGPDTIICQGDSVTFDAGACLGCMYQWTDITTGLPIGTEQTLTRNQSGVYEVEVTSSGNCTVRDTVQMIVTPPPVITNNPLFKPICSGESTLIPLTSNVPNTDFSWTAFGSSAFVSGYSPGSGNTIDQVLTNTGSGPETVSYWITPAVGSCVGDSAQYVVTVTLGDSVSISISGSSDSICAGTSVTFTASSVNTGTNPLFQWYINGVDTNFSDSVFTYTPAQPDTIYCVVTSFEPCRSNNPDTSNSIIVNVLPNLPVSISITPSENPVCEGELVTFLATSTNRGRNPVYQWNVNGSLVGINDSVYAYIPIVGDQVWCQLTSSEQCTTNNPATSDTVTMQVNPLLPVGITISVSANPVCGGIPVTYTSIPINGGSSPGYQWQVNGFNTANTSVYTYLPVNGDVVTCILTSNAECLTNNPAISNPITMSVGEAPDVSFAVCFDTVTILNAKPFKLKGGVPLGGTYSGPGVDQITGYFNPAMAGVGLKTISYSYTNQYNCSDYAVKSISVMNPFPFTCGDSLTDIRDNKKYPTIQIGSQCWLAVNLNHGQQIDGSSAQRDNCLVEKYCYNDFPPNCTQYGALYQWDELMRYEDVEEIQGLCPPGWHVASEADWNQLFAVYQGNAFAGSPLLHSGFSGFNVLLNGVEFFNKSWSFADFASLIWSSTAHGPWKAWSHGLNDYNYSVSYYPSYRSNAFPVRCVLD